MVNNIYQHYRPDEQPFIDTVYDWIHSVDHNYTPHLTYFLTPRERMILQQLVNGFEDIQVAFDGGGDEEERQRALIYPPYYVILEDDFELALLEVTYPTKFGELSHGQILGTILNQGMDRNRIGDIITDGERWQVIVDQNMASFIINSVQKISNLGVRIDRQDWDDKIENIEQWELVSIVSSSMRLDTVLSNVYNFSRQRAKDAIQQSLVKVNFIQVDRPDVELAVKDIVSLRRFGRFWIDNIEGQTKKDNYILSVKVIKR